MERQTLSNWIARQKDFDRVVLRHVSPVGKIDGDIASFEFLDGEAIDVNKLAEDVLTAANADADGLTGVQQYIAVLCQGEKSKARLPFRVAAESDEVDGDTVTSEPASKTGLLSQLMRHNEALMRMAVLAQENVTRSLSRALQAATAQNEHMQAKHFENVEVIEQMLSTKQDRELKAHESEVRSAHLGEMVGTVKLLVPAIAKRVLGGNSGESVASPDVNGAAMTALRDSLMSDPTRAGRIMELLTESERAVLLEMMGTPSN